MPGILFESRYKATLIDSESYLLNLLRYIELNPVRAGLVAYSAGYPWSSHHANALGQAQALITQHPEYLRLGETREDRQEASEPVPPPHPPKEHGRHQERHQQGLGAGQRPLQAAHPGTAWAAGCTQGAGRGQEVGTI